MIDENITFILFGYTSADLSHGSGKKVLAICNDCGKERIVIKNRYRDLCTSCTQKGNTNMLGKHHSEETKQKISKGNRDKHLSDETKQKISKAHIDKHHTEETKCKISKSQQGTHMGENHPNWKGGTKLTRARADTKRRELFGFIPHNKAQKDFHGHHLDFNHVIFIPKELHRSIYHSVTKNINMNLINDITCDWYLNYQIQ